MDCHEIFSRVLWLYLLTFSWFCPQFVKYKAKGHACTKACVICTQRCEWTVNRLHPRGDVEWTGESSPVTLLGVIIKQGNRLSESLTKLNLEHELFAQDYSHTVFSLLVKHLYKTAHNCTCCTWGSRRTASFSGHYSSDQVDTWRCSWGLTEVAHSEWQHRKTPALIRFQSLSPPLHSPVNLFLWNPTVSFCSADRAAVLWDGIPDAARLIFTGLDCDGEDGSRGGDWGDKMQFCQWEKSEIEYILKLEFLCLWKLILTVLKYDTTLILFAQILVTCSDTVTTVNSSNGGETLPTSVLTICTINESSIKLQRIHHRVDQTDWLKV